MSRAVKEKSIDGATGTESGSRLETGGRITLSLFVVADTDPTTLDVQIEGSMDGTNWSTLKKGGSDRGILAAADFSDPEGDGEFAAFAGIHGIAVQYVRARITGYGSAGNVDAWVAATSNSGTAYDYRETGGA